MTWVLTILTCTAIGWVVGWYSRAGLDRMRKTGGES